MCMKTEVDHTRGLCHEPDVPNDTPRAVVEANPAHCLCCHSEMVIEEMSDSFAMLGMFRLVCPVCP
jgi:hypothetical protein